MTPEPPPEQTIAKCGACQGAVYWVTMNKTGRLNPLDVAATEPEVGKGVIARNPHRLTGESVTKDNIDEVDGWRAAGATFHVSHFATCPEADRYKRQNRH